MSDDPNHENELLWASLEQNADEINRLVDMQFILLLQACFCATLYPNFTNRP